MNPIPVALALFAASAAFAQAPAARRDPTDPQARIPAVEYRSAFENYRAERDPPATNWREANENVRRIGGHAGYVAKPGGAGEKYEAKGSAPKEKSNAGGHDGHHR